MNVINNSWLMLLFPVVEWDRKGLSHILYISRANAIKPIIIKIYLISFIYGMVVNGYPHPWSWHSIDRQFLVDNDVLWVFTEETIVTIKIALWWIGEIRDNHQMFGIEKKIAQTPFQLIEGVLMPKGGNVLHLCWPHSAVTGCCM